MIVNGRLRMEGNCDRVPVINKGKGFGSGKRRIVDVLRVNQL